MPPHLPMHRFFLALLLACLSPVAWSQSHHWVDPVTGLDSGPGTEAQPFKTLLHALAAASNGGRIDLQPGTYSEASGESFPLSFSGAVQVSSVAGKSSTRIHGSGMSLASLHSGCSLTGVELTSDVMPNVHGAHLVGQPRPVVRDCDFLGSSTAIAGSDLDLVGCRFMAQTCRAIAPYWGELRLVDCEIVGTATSTGLGNVFVYYELPDAKVELVRCSITGCGEGAIKFLGTTHLADMSLLVQDSVITGNPGGGVDVYTGPGVGFMPVRLDGCTIATNGAVGVRGAYTSTTDLHSSIVFGHSTHDVLDIGAVEYTLVGDGSHPAGTGNLTGDPRFVDPAGQDWTLRFDSPCLDRASPDLWRLDRAGRARAVDSDLDLVPGPDMGAFEHRTLTGVPEAVLGQTFELGVTGPAGGFSTLIVGPLGYAHVGSTTSFGRIFLNPQGAFRVQPAPTTGGAPTMIDLTAVLDPAWVGTSVGFQALSRSFAAPAGGAYSNPLLVSIR